MAHGVGVEKKASDRCCNFLANAIMMSCPSGPTKLGRGLLCSIIFFQLIYPVTCQPSPQAVSREGLLNFRNAVENWPQFAAANEIQGWDDNLPMCLWTGILCNDEGAASSLILPCTTCTVRARGRLPPDLSLLRTLQTVNLEGQAFYGGIPPQWFFSDAFINLENLYLSNNPLGGPLPAVESGALNRLTQLRVSGCNLTGTLPTTWGLESMRALSVIRAADNDLTGTLPETWGTYAAFPDLNTLDLSNNRLQGNIPALWGNPQAMRFLRDLYLGGNNFTGGLPPEFGDPRWSRVVFLRLEGNPFLGGTIPVEWAQNGSFSYLRSLDISNCGLTGQLLSNWPASLPLVDVINVANNSLVGPIPPSYANFTNLKRLVVKPGNDGLCGPIPPDLPFALCDDRDITCLRLEVGFQPQCPQNLPPPPDTFAALSSQTDTSSPGSASASSSSSSSSSSSNTSSGGDDSSSLGAILGGVLGGLSALAVATAAAIFFITRHRRKQRNYSNTIGSSSYKPSELPFWSQDDSSPPRDGLAFDRPTPHRPITGPTAFGNPQSPPTFRSILADLNSQSTSRLGSQSTPEENYAEVMVGVGVGGGMQQKQQHQHSLQQDPAFATSTSSTASGRNERPREFELDDWRIDPIELVPAKRQDGSEWLLGSGGFGMVFKALRNGVQPVAVKILPGGPVGGGIEVNEDGKEEPQQRSRTEDAIREIAIMRACRDPNLVAFQGAYVGEDNILLVTEYMEGGNLRHNLDGGRVTWYRRGRKIAIDVAKGLTFLHNRRIIHFDLKSPNILLTRDGTAKIGDIGLAKFLQRDYVTGVVATLAWSAPEILWGAKCTQKADIYSFGIVLWEICTGEPPERGRLRDVRVPEECPPEVRQIMLDCLESRPSMRPTAAQLVDRLQRTPADGPHPEPSGSSSTLLVPGQPTVSGPADGSVSSEAHHTADGEKAGNTSEERSGATDSPFAAAMSAG